MSYLNSWSLNVLLTLVNSTKIVADPISKVALVNSVPTAITISHTAINAVVTQMEQTLRFATNKMRLVSVRRM